MRAELQRQQHITERIILQQEKASDVLKEHYELQ